MSDAVGDVVHMDRPMAAIGMRLVAGFLFGIMFAAIKLSGEHGVGLIEAMFYRNLIACPLVLCWVAARRGVGALRTQHIGRHVTRAGVGLFGMCFTFGSYRMLPLAEATTISFTVPIFATILAVVFLREQVRIHRWSAVLVGFVGVLLVTRPGSGSIPLLGALVALMSALMISVISLQLRQLGRTEAATTTTFYFSLFGTIALLPAMPFVFAPHDAGTWGIIIVIGIVGGLAQMAGSASLRLGAVSLVVAMDYAQLIWATLFGWLLFAQLPAPTTWTGAPLIIASGLYIAWREHKRKTAISGSLPKEGVL